MEARNRKMTDWYGCIKRGEIKLPRFQRFEAWDHHRISSLMQMVIQNLPLGITLVLEVGDSEKFISRYLATAPGPGGRIHEHLLDGQQRLTALWRVLHNNYEGESYFIYLRQFDQNGNDEERDDLSVYCRNRWTKKSTGQRFPIWCDDPAQCLRRGMVPTHLLRPEDIQAEVDAWIDEATGPSEPLEGGKEELKQFFEFKKAVSDRIKDLRSVLANYNLPYLSLPASTDKSVALTVFINMNTNSKPLSQYDIIVAEVESVMDRSLHDLEAGLSERHPTVNRFGELSNLILTTSALLQGQLPNQRGAWDMDKRKLVENWNTLERCLARMASFLASEGVFDEQRLPTNAVLAPIAALYAHIPETGDKRGQDELMLKRFFWYACFTDRYENAAATRAFSDFNALKNILTDARKPDGAKYRLSDVPIFGEYSLAEAEELITAEWPKRATIRGRAILAATCRLGALDFATAEKIDASNIAARHYHHLYPDALLKEAGINGFLALNCSLIADATNLSIGRKDPVRYLADRYKWTSEAIVRERLHSHLIPIKELANGGYEGLSETEKIAKLKPDFDAFIQKRADLVVRVVKSLVDGRQLSAAEIFDRG